MTFMTRRAFTHAVAGVCFTGAGGRDNGLLLPVHHNYQSHRAPEVPYAAVTLHESDMSPDYEGPVGLGLSLAMDASGSMKENEFRLQTIGLANALVAPEVVAKIMPIAPIAISVLEFGEEPVPQLGWSLIMDERDIRRFAGKVADMAKRERRKIEQTFVSPAIIGATNMQLGCKYRTQVAKWVTDVFGDGDDQDTMWGAEATMKAVAEAATMMGTTVNGLAIGDEAHAFYEACVKTPFNTHAHQVDLGDGRTYPEIVQGGFVHRIASYAEVEAGLVRKLTQEIAMAPGRTRDYRLG